MNASNESTLPTEDISWDKIWVYIAYVVVGVIVGGTNLFVVFLVLHFKALRTSKEYLVVLSLSLADGCNMMA